MFGAGALIMTGCDFSSSKGATIPGVHLGKIEPDEDIFRYIVRNKGQLDRTMYRQIIGATNEFKEGDLTLEVAAADEASRSSARTLLSNTKIKDLHAYSLYEDELEALINESTQENPELENWTMGELKAFLLTSSETDIKAIMPSLTSDIIACVVKLMSNDELIQIGQKVFNPLPNSKIGSKGYLSARVQPNSPTDNIDDIIWQVFDAWAYAVGDLVLGTNPVSSEPASVAKIEKALFEVISTFGLQETIPNCVLSHIDIQAEVEATQPGTTGIWFQSLAGTVNANKTFDVSIEKMMKHTDQRTGQYGLYAETGQGADFTNGHGEGFDMVVHEARKYGFLRAIKQKMSAGKSENEVPWVHVNDVAGFIGPEVFKTKEQLVRCCLEDTVMGKLHGLPIGLDICSTLHMDVSLDDLDWCIEQIMPANPAYLMALPTKNDPMLSYLTTAFHNHVKIRNQFGYKVNDAMWDFFKKLEVIDANGNPTKHFGDPIWVYYKYLQAKSDKRTEEEIYTEGRKVIAEVRERGVAIAEGYGKMIWDLESDLAHQVKLLYEDAKVSLWTEMPSVFANTIPASLSIASASVDRKDYVYHPTSGEELSKSSLNTLKELKSSWRNELPDVQIIISDGLNARAIMDDGHLLPYLEALIDELSSAGYSISNRNLIMQNGRVRAGYACGEVLFGQEGISNQTKGIIHIIGERPGSGHHNFSAYLTAATKSQWFKKGSVDHDISRVVSGISDTALEPKLAAKETANIFHQLFLKQTNLEPNG
ncbi:MAG: ethanolamine ammonia-lyase subunit EutB [Cytophagia bacterium]|nr:ethanolamine ammonia-lyase subunit EutB [Cytophagia bacterium]